MLGWGMERHPATLVAQPQAWGQASSISEGEGGGTESKEGLPMKGVPQLLPWEESLEPPGPVTGSKSPT